MTAPWRIDFWTWLSLFALGVALWLTVTYAGLILEISAILFGAFLLSLGLKPLADRLARWHVPRAVAVLLAYIGLFALIALLGYLLTPVIRNETSTLRTDGPLLMQQVTSRFSSTPIAGWIPSVDTGVQALAQRMDTLIVDAASTAFGIGATLLDIVALLILTFFMTTDQAAGADRLIRWVPSVWRAPLQEMWPDITNRLSRWVWAQGAIGLFFALASTGGLLLLGVPYAFTLGLVGGVLAIIPYLGNAVAAILATLSALTVSFPLAILVLLLYIFLATIESHFVAPVLYGRALGLHSSGVLIALLIGLKGGGIVGLFFAVPVAVVLMALFQAMQAKATGSAA